MAKTNRYGIDPNDPDFAEHKVAATYLRGMLEGQDQDTRTKVLNLTDSLQAQVDAHDVGELTLAAVTLLFGRILNADGDSHD